MNYENVVLDQSTKANREITRLLVSGSVKEQVEVLKLLIKHRVVTYLDIVRELMLFADDSSVRIYAFYVVALMGQRSDAEDLLEAIATESSQDYRTSMMDMFAMYAKKHNITAENIEIIATAESIVSSRETSRSQSPMDKSTSSNAIDNTKEQVLSYIFDMSADIPISVHRLSDIVGIPVEKLQLYLKQFAKEHPESMTYLDFEQVFIKNTVTLRKMIDPSPLRSIACSNCNQDTNSFPCEHCGAGLQCNTCRLPIGKKEKVLTCPNCQGANHEKHILEWVKIRGICPNCKKPLNDKQLRV